MHAHKNKPDTHKSPGAYIGSWIEAKKNTQGPQVESVSLAAPILRYEHGTA